MFIEYNYMILEPNVNWENLPLYYFGQKVNISQNREMGLFQLIKQQEQNCISTVFKNTTL